VIVVDVQHILGALRYHTLFETLKLPMEAASFPKHLVQAVLSQPPRRDLTGAVPNGDFGSRLHELFDVPQHVRTELVRNVVESVLKLAGNFFVSVYRLDVREVDRVHRRLRVLVDARLYVKDDVVWTFEFTAPPRTAGLSFALEAQVSP
jgi:hypothetical protein